MNSDLAPGPLDLDALARILVQRPPLEFQRRIHRRHLGDHAAECGQRLLQRRAVKRHRSLDDHLALDIAGGSDLAELDGGTVALVGIQQIGRELGRLAEAHRQQAGRQRIEHAGMAGLGRAVQPARLLQRAVAAEAIRLIQQQHAIDVQLDATRRAHALSAASSSASSTGSSSSASSASLPASWATVTAVPLTSSIRRLMYTPRSMESS